MTEFEEEIESTGLPLVAASSVLAVLAGGLLLCSQLTLFDGSGFFSVGEASVDGDQLFDRQFRLMFVLWPILALGLSILAALKQSAVAISVGLGALVLTASYGLSLLVGYIDAFGVGDAGDGGAVRSTVYVVGVLSVAVAAAAAWWILELFRSPTSDTGTPLWRVLGMAAFAVSFAASLVSVLRFNRDFDVPLWPQLVGLFFVGTAIAALATGTKVGAAFAAAAAAARLADTFDVVVIRRVPFSIVAETLADVIVILSLAVALLCSLTVLFPTRDGFRSGAVSLRKKLALADEWDD